MDEAYKVFFNRNTPYLKFIQSTYSQQFDKVKTKQSTHVDYGIDECWTQITSGTKIKATDSKGKRLAQRDKNAWIAWQYIESKPSVRLLYAYTFKDDTQDSVFIYSSKSKRVKAELYANKKNFNVNTTMYLMPLRFSDFTEFEEQGITTLQSNISERVIIDTIKTLSALKERTFIEASPRGRMKCHNLLLIVTGMILGNPKWHFAMKYLSAAKQYVTKDLNKIEPFIEFQNGGVNIIADDTMCPIRIIVLITAAYRAMNWGDAIWIDEVTSYLFHNPYHNVFSLKKFISPLFTALCAYNPSQLESSKMIIELLKKFPHIENTAVEKELYKQYHVNTPYLAPPLDWTKSYDILECTSVNHIYYYNIVDKAFAELNAININASIVAMVEKGLEEYACRWWLCLTALPSKELVQEATRLQSVLEWPGYVAEDTVTAHSDTLNKGALDSSKQDLQSLDTHISSIVKQYMDAIPPKEVWTPEQFKQAIPRNMTNNSAGMGSFKIASVEPKFSDAEYVSSTLKSRYGGTRPLEVGSQTSKLAWWYLLGEGMIGLFFTYYKLLVHQGIRVPHKTVVRRERAKQERSAYSVMAPETIATFLFAWISNFVQSHSGTLDSGLAGWPYMINQSKGSPVTDISPEIKATAEMTFAETLKTFFRIIFSLDFTSWDLRLTMLDKVVKGSQAFQYLFGNDPRFAHVTYLEFEGVKYTYQQIMQMADALLMGAEYSSTYLYHKFTFNASFMPSGHKYTLNFNSLINHAIARKVFGAIEKEFGVKVVNGRIQGDDNIWIVEADSMTEEKYKQMAERLVELCNNISLEINIYKSVIRATEFEFAKLYALAGMMFQPLTISMLKAEEAPNYIRTTEFFRALSGLSNIATMRGESIEVHEAYLLSAFAIRGSELVQSKDEREFVFYPPIMFVVPKAYQGIGYSPVTDNADTLLMTVPIIRHWTLSHAQVLSKLAPEQGFAAQLGESLAKNAMNVIRIMYMTPEGEKRHHLTLDWFDTFVKERGQWDTMKIEVKESETAFIVPSGEYKGMIPYVNGVIYAIKNMSYNQLKMQWDALVKLGPKMKIPKEYYYSNMWYLDTKQSVAANESTRKIDFESRAYDGKKLYYLDEVNLTNLTHSKELPISNVLDIRYVEQVLPKYPGAAIFLASVLEPLASGVNLFGISGVSVPDQFSTPLRALNSSTTFNANVSIPSLINLVNGNLALLFNTEMLIGLFVIMGASFDVASDVAGRLNLSTISTAIVNTGYAYNGSVNAVLNLTEERLKHLVIVESLAGGVDTFTSRVQRIGQLVAAIGILTNYVYTQKETMTFLNLRKAEYGRYVAKTTNLEKMLGTEAFSRYLSIQSYWMLE